MPKLRELLDDKSEVAALIVALIGAAWLGAVVYLQLQETPRELNPWVGVALLVGALVTYVGKSTYEGITISPTEGVRIEGGRDD